MQEELAKMDKYKVWEVVPRSPDMRVVGARWVYTRKTDGETGKPSAYKAPKGFSQIEGIDFNELFAAVAHKDYSSRVSTISTLNAIRSISKRLSSMATLRRQSILHHQKVYRQTKSYICGNLIVSSNRHAVSTKHLVKGLLQLEPIPAFIPDDKAIHS